MAQSMTPDEIREFLLTEPAHTAKVATVRPDGRPHVAPVWFTLDGDDRIVFSTWHKTVKATNLQHDPRLAITVDDERPPFSFVLVEGRAHIEREAPDMLQWTMRIAGRYMGQDLAQQFGERNAVPGEWLVRVTPTKMRGEKNLTE